MSNQKKPSKKIAVAISNVTFKGGLRNINLKYVRSNPANISCEQWCVTAIAEAAGVWLAVCTGGKSVNACQSCDSIRSIRNVLAQHIGDSELLYVMNAYICGVTNSKSLSDAQHITAEYEKYISGNNTLTARQKNILLRGFRGFYKEKALQREKETRGIRVFTKRGGPA